MKDRELRKILKDKGIIHDNEGEFPFLDLMITPNYNRDRMLENREIIKAIIDHLGLKEELIGKHWELKKKDDNKEKE